MNDERRRDFRREGDKEVNDLHDSLYRLQKGLSNLEGKVESLNVAIFGHPNNRNDGGIVGDLNENRERLGEMNRKLDRLYLTGLGLIISFVGGTAGMIAAITSIH